MKIFIIVIMIIMSGPAYCQVPADSMYRCDLAEEPASYPGGLASLSCFITTNLVIDTDGLEGGCITFWLRFTVCEDGTLQDASLSTRTMQREQWNREANRIIDAMPLWQPAKRNGKPVKCFYNLPVRIRLS